MYGISSQILISCVVESSFICHDRAVETQSGYYSESKKPGMSTKALLVSSGAVLVLCLGDSDCDGASGGE